MHLSTVVLILVATAMAAPAVLHHESELKDGSYGVSVSPAVSAFEVKLGGAQADECSYIVCQNW